MDTFLKTAMGVIVIAVIYVALPKEAKQLSVVLTIASCCMIGFVAFHYITPVVEFTQKVSDVGNLNSDMVKTLLKAVGICYISEFTSLICQDAGNSALSKMIQVMTSALLLSMSIPFLTQLLNIVQNLLTKI